MSGALRSWWPLALSASVAACGATAPASNSPRSPQPYSASVSGRQGDEIPVPMALYTTEPTPGAVQGGEPARIVERALLSEIHARRGETLRGDGRLAALAAWVAGRMANGQVPNSGEIDDVSRRVGHVGPTPALVFVQGSQITQPVVEGMLEKATRDLPTNLPLARYAIAERSLGSDSVWAIVLASLELALKPVPRRLSHGDTVHLSGKLADRFDFAHLAITLPGGQVRTFDNRGRGFAADLRLDRAGIYRIEIEGDGKEGPVVVANFPVYVDVDDPPPRARDDRAQAGGTATAAGVEDRLLVLLNSARERTSLRPLAGDADLAAIARAHSQDMVDHAFFGHVSPETGSTDDRVKRAHLGRLGAYGENLVLGASAEDAHGQLMNSPGHRGNMLRGEFTHVGIGAVSQSLAGGHTVFTVTYLFAQRLR
jgi:uncharacterized protein YkwD